MVPRGADAELFVVGARLEDANVLFVVESSTAGLSVEADPSMGVRAASLTTLTLDGVHVPEDSVLGAVDGTTYAECVRLSRIAWCALAVGVGQAVLDHVTPYVKQRRGFRRAGRPPPVGRLHGRRHRDRAAGDAAADLEGRLACRGRPGRRARGRPARTLCGEKGMQIGLDGVQLLGGHGFVKEHPVERWYRDLRAVAIMEGGVLV